MCVQSTQSNHQESNRNQEGHNIGQIPRHKVGSELYIFIYSVRLQMTSALKLGMSVSKLILFIFAVLSKNKSYFSGRLHFQSLELDGGLHMGRRFHSQ